ncbi:phosphodiester glycosidase family protein [Kitasatospora sp. NPDC088346]|uniref:phosphodiester glycosidase family protein n=1 Tax=Kitasatospora sp. NPDC088346 TaxID=3364073 RepID=UPI003800220E
MLTRRGAGALLLGWLTAVSPPLSAVAAVDGGAGRPGAAERIAPGVEYRAFSVPGPHGSTRVHVLTVDLRRGVRAGLLYPGAVAARRAVSRMVEEQGAVAGINGDFFDIDERQHPGVEATGAASGPAVLAGRALKAAVPQGQRFGWAPPPGDTSRDVVGVGVDGVARTGQLTLRGRLRTRGGSLPLGGLDQYALPVGSIGVFTPQWGPPSRARAVCGTDLVRAAPCTGDSHELTVRAGRVVSVADRPGSGALPAGTLVLLGREGGAEALRRLGVGTAVEVDYRLTSDGPVPFTFALGAYPLLRGGRPLPGLDTAAALPRSAVGLADGGHVLRLLSTDGREGDSTGLTLSELAEVLRSLDCEEASYLDGGASATLATRDPGSGRVTVRNHLDHDTEREVPNGIAVFAR